MFQPVLIIHRRTICVSWKVTVHYLYPSVDGQKYPKYVETNTNDILYYCILFYIV
jgi:hypothetical protein